MAGIDSNTTDYISSDVESLITMPFYMDSISRIVELLAIAIIIGVVIYIFVKVKNVPGRIMMLVGAIGSAVSFFAPIFVFLSLGQIASSLFAVITILQIIGALFLLVASIGFIRFAIAVRKQGES